MLELMATGASNAGIAESMVITQRAAEKYVSTIFSKLGIPATGSESRRVLAVSLFSGPSTSADLPHTSLSAWSPEIRPEAASAPPGRLLRPMSPESAKVGISPFRSDL